MSKTNLTNNKGKEERLDVKVTVKTTSDVLDHKKEREADVKTIIDSAHPRKVVVAGPGTGKSHLFQEVIKKEKANGKTKFLAITFIGKLGDSLADDLAGLAETMTLHGFARRFVLDMCPKGWEYFPDMFNLVKKDLNLKGISKFSIADSYYEECTKHYKAIGDEDVIAYAVKICQKNEKKIPIYDLILVDEFQDFNEIESQFIDILASKNKILIVGDDDQALYEFKGSSPKYIREKFSKDNTNYESHTLRFCSRCTEVIINAFHSVVKKFGLSQHKSGRVEKQYICYLPGKKEDSVLNPKILVSVDTKVGLIPYLIKDELNKILETQQVKSVLILGEGRSCKKLLSDIAQKMLDFGFKNVDYSTNYENLFSLNQQIINGYKILSKGLNPLLAWRLLSSCITEQKPIERLILDSYKNPDAFIKGLPNEFKELHIKNSKVLDKILNKPPSEIKQIANSSIESLEKEIVMSKKSEREIFISQIIKENKNLPRPLGNLEITICNILGSKGLGADVVFLIGFDQGKLPSKNEIEDSEIYQLLVALTRAKKRIYLINSIGSKVSNFLDYFDKESFEFI